MAEDYPQFESYLASVVTQAASSPCPARFGEALQYAVFPGGARVRPRLCLAVARANGMPDKRLSLAAAGAIELLHCASLVHDDLPCFDDADERRGKASVHKLFGERLAVLTGDALIVLAYQSLMDQAPKVPNVNALNAVHRCISIGVGAPFGICAGQAWECEDEIDLHAYHRAKTAALFIASTCVGAASAGADPALWQLLGDRIGEAYQVADDILDACAETGATGKPVGQDAIHDRPNAVARMGLECAVQRFKILVSEGVEAIPECNGRPELQTLVRAQAESLLPKKLVLRAA